MRTGTRVAAAVFALVALAGPNASAREGALDADFGAGGIELVDASIAPARGSGASGVVVLPDGRIVVAGFGASSSGNGAALMRFTRSGAVDTSFGSAGRTVTVGLRPRDLVRLPDGRLVIAGDGATPDGNVSIYFAAARYTADGAVDTAFGSGGVARFAFPGQHSQGNAMALTRDGKVVVTGIDDSDDAGVVRFTSAGAPDPTFGSGGGTGVPFGRSSDGQAVAVQPDGRILIAAEILPPGPPTLGAPTSFGVARLNDDGSLDRSFGHSGTVITALTTAGREIPQAVVLQPDGKIVVTGSVGEGMAVVRYNPDGTLDSTFGSGGAALSSIGVALGMTRQSDGKIVVVGSAGDADEHQALLVARFTANGVLDPSFGDHGSVVTQASASGARPFSLAGAVAVQPDRKIVAAGFGEAGGPDTVNEVFALVRYADDAPPVVARVLPRVDIRVLPGGSAPVPVACQDTGLAVCRGRVDLTVPAALVRATAVRRRPRTVTIASGAFAIKKTLTRIVRAHLNTTGRRLLRHRARVAVTAVISVRRGRATVRTTRRLVLRR
jgi:uncharacterized delta-60 repeat protein